MAAEFLPFSASGITKPFLSISQDSVSMLEGITSAEKALSVPLVRIWEVDPNTGKPAHADSNGNPKLPLSVKFNSPPRFGESLDNDAERYRERPGVSLERITIKNDAPRGFITYRTLELSFMVHRPDVIFEPLSSDGDTWSSLIIPGTVHVIEYGWRSGSGVKNGILNGLGEGPIPAISRVRFTVTNYNFTMMTDNQIHVTVSAIEDSEFNLRQIELTGPKQTEVRKIKKRNPVDVYSDKGQPLLGELQKRIDDLSQRGEGGLVKVKDILDVLFVPAISNAYKEIGYGEPKLYLGDFNERVGTPIERYRKASSNFIGDFQIPMKDVRDLFARLIVKEHQQITLQNFITPLFEIFRDPRTWDRKKGKKDEAGNDVHTIPQIFMRTINNPAKNSAAVYIFDAEREFTKFTESDYYNFKKNPTREQLKKILKDKGVPFISFGKGNSYLFESQFEVVNDDQMKSLFINRFYAPTRDKLTQKPSKEQKLNRIPDASKVLYSSAIQGDLNMIGNFAFDMFGLVWLDFGVPVWSGLFNVRAREDTIEPASFTTRISLVSEGIDPLDTQGRRGAKLFGPF